MIDPSCNFEEGQGSINSLRYLVIRVFFIKIEVAVRLKSVLSDPIKYLDDYFMIDASSI